MDTRVTITHWLPAVTFCPVNNLPDLLYVEVEFDGATFVELYGARKKIKSLIQWKKCFMEEVAGIVHAAFPDALKVTVRLAFNKHIVISRR